MPSSSRIATMVDEIGQPIGGPHHQTLQVHMRSECAGERAGQADEISRKQAEQGIRQRSWLDAKRHQEGELVCNNFGDWMRLSLLGGWHGRTPA